jgi:hypothetical protein
VKQELFKTKDLIKRANIPASLVASVVFLLLQTFHRLKHSLALLLKSLILNSSCFTSGFCRVPLVTNRSQTQADLVKQELVKTKDLKQESQNILESMKCL